MKNFIEEIDKCLKIQNSNIIMPVKNLIFILDYLDLLNKKYKQKNLKIIIISDTFESLTGY